ncbi:MAG: acetylornithine/succinylornithine family transaminase [Fibrobacteres bacterium]|nr:acetylornithine/succinylornithine family transaminase [Fibrobacterota bacterium]
MSTSNIIAKERKYLLQNYARPEDFIPVKGKGSWLTDINGKKYLDFVSGIAVNAFGHNYAPLLKAIAGQSKKFIHCSNLYFYDAMLKPAEILVKKSCADRAFFCNSGTEANEAAIKFARRFCVRKKSKEKIEVISFRKGFHGRTYGALSATAQAKYQEDFGPMLPGFTYCDYNSTAALKKAVSNKTAAIMMEFLQGEGGGEGATPEFIKTLLDLKKKYGFLLIADEIQSGLGRTGKFLCHEWYGVKPDIITLAKPLGGGLPLGAVLLTQVIADEIKPGDHGTTFGGNPVACAAAEVVLSKVTDNKFLKEVSDKGKLLVSLLKAIKSPKIVAIKGRGLWIAVELKDGAPDAINAMRKKGLLTVRAGDQCIRFLPPLNVTVSEIKKAVAIFKSVL